MAGTAGGGGSMDYEYDSQNMSGSHTDPMRTGGRISRCPALAHGSWGSFSSGPYYASPSHMGWQQGAYNTNHLSGLNSHQHMSFGGYHAHLPAQGPSLHPLPEPRGSHSSRPQETAVPAAAVYNPRRYAGLSLPDLSPPPVTASSPDATSALPPPAADRQVSPSSTLSSLPASGQPHPAAETSGPDANSSPSPPSSTPASQPLSTTSSSAQREGQNPSARSPHAHSTARVRLPAPGNIRQRMTLGNYARYRDVADYLELAEYQASHAAHAAHAARTASQTSDDDSDRDFDPRAYNSFGPAYLQTARQSQILRGQMNNKRVASKRAVQSLQKVDVDSLPDNEKTCVICYNDFGVASPEGTVETPLRLPKCKHVFGNQCILKWLEESYSCPYCRDKLESEMARPDQETIRRMLTDSELTNLPPSVRPRVSRTQTSDRAEVRPEAQSLLRARRSEIEVTRDSVSRGERRAAPPEDSSDAQRRQRPRFSVDGFTPGTTTAPTQNPSPAQHIPTWQHGATFGNHWAMTPQYTGAGAPPAGHQPNYTLPPFPMNMPGFAHDLNGSNFPPMFSREDYHRGPQNSELAETGVDISRASAAHEYPLPRPLHTFARHMNYFGDPSNYATHQQTTHQAYPYSNMAQPVRSDGPPQSGAYSGFPNRN